MKKFNYETPSLNFRRLIDSCDTKFNLSITLENDSSKEKQINVETTVNIVFESSFKQHQ